jgi:hypothetical protein
MAGLGTGGYPHPRRCDPRAIETLAPLEPCHLADRGHLLLAGATTEWRFPEFTAVVVVEHATRVLISIDGGEPVGVGIVRQGLFGQLLFACPQCQHLRRRLYVIRGVIGCRGKNCFHIDPRSRHSHRYGVGRAVNLAGKLRLRLGGHPTLFGPVPPRDRDRLPLRVHNRLVAELAVLEGQALAAFGETLAAAERRARGRKRTRR